MQCVGIEGTYHFHSLTFTVHPYSALGLDGCKPICAELLDFFLSLGRLIGHEFVYDP